MLLLAGDLLALASVVFFAYCLSDKVQVHSDTSHKYHDLFSVPHFVKEG